MKKIAILILIIIFITVIITSCDIDYIDFNYIRYNGIDYIEERIIEEGEIDGVGFRIVERCWEPITKMKEDQVKVTLIDYNSNVMSGEYYAQMYENDNETIFLYFKNVVYFRSDYVFPDYFSENVLIDKIILTDSNGKEYTINEETYLNLFMKEYRNENNSVSEYNGGMSYEVTIYPSNFIACHKYARIIGCSTEGIYGFLGQKIVDKFISEELNDYIKELLK